MGLQAENIIKWPQNGIEYYYPPTLLEKIFGMSGSIEINGDRISRNGIAYTKNELVEKVVTLLEPSTPQHEQFETMFLQPLAAKIG